MKDILIVFYSRTGTTRRLAHEVAVACRADLEEVRDVRPRGGVRGYVRSLSDALFDRIPDIRPVECDPRSYAVTVLGGPVWLGTLPSPLRAYILEYRRDFREIGAFCTARSSFTNRMLRKVAVLSRRRPVIQMAFSMAEVQRGLHEERAREFAEALRDHVDGIRARRAKLHEETES